MIPSWIPCRGTAYGSHHVHKQVRKCHCFTCSAHNSLWHSCVTAIRSDHLYASQSCKNTWTVIRFWPPHVMPLQSASDKGSSIGLPSQNSVCTTKGLINSKTADNGNQFCQLADLFLYWKLEALIQYCLSILHSLTILGRYCFFSAFW